LKPNRAVLKYGGNERLKEKATNASINSELLQQANILKINLFATLEQELAHLIRRKRRAEWLEENRRALDHYNTFVAKLGVFSDRLRRF
jgi:antitoxin CcdA